MSSKDGVSTIPYTPTSKCKSVNPRPLLPIYPHPALDSIETPALPSPPRSPVSYTNTNGVYLRSTHLVPAAFPRLVPDIPLPQIPQYSAGGSPAARLEKLGAVVNEAMERQAKYMEGTLGGGRSEKLLWNCIDRFVRMSRRSVAGVTLFLAHANGFHKEIWETMIRSLLDSPAGSMVDEVWAWDAVQHGEAAVMNAKNLSGIFDWLDNTRDIANFLLHYLPEDVDAEALPTRLKRLPDSVTEGRGERGYCTRKLVVVGHSFGGCTSMRAAVDFPKLFSSIILVDPIICRPHMYRRSHIFQMVLGAFMRRDRWASREEALQLLNKSPFFSAWNPEVLQLYVDHGLIDDGHGGVKLKMSGLQEGLSFANYVPAWETWELLKNVDEAITLRWIVPEDSLTLEDTRERVWLRPANSTNVVFNFSGHLIVHEAPRELAQDISDFLLRKYGSTKPRL